MIIIVLVIIVKQWLMMTIMILMTIINESMWNDNMTIEMPMILWSVLMKMIIDIMINDSDY